MRFDGEGRGEGWTATPRFERSNDAKPQCENETVPRGKEEAFPFLIRALCPRSKMAPPAGRHAIREDGSMDVPDQGGGSATRHRATGGGLGQQSAGQQNYLSRAMFFSFLTHITA